MKTTYTNEQLQEAIDVAFHESSGDDGFWIGIARAFLDNLPEQTEQEVLSLSQLRPLSDIHLPSTEKLDPLVTKSEWTPQVGDVVRLKSGGPLMAISGFRFNGDVVCRWFEHFTPHNGTFEFCCLEPAAKEDAR
jgi:uncharacterized protein YodC (DUF2158 family)